MTLYEKGAWAAWQWAIEMRGQKEIADELDCTVGYVSFLISLYACGRIPVSVWGWPEYGEDRRRALPSILQREFPNGPPLRPQLQPRRMRPRLRWMEPPRFRPIDLGGPRDVWLAFTVSPDPRLDAFIPVRP